MTRRASFSSEPNNYHRAPGRKAEVRKQGQLQALGKPKPRQEQQPGENNMAFKLAVENKVCVTVKGKIAGADKGAGKPFNFTLTCDRMTQAAITEAMKSGDTIEDFVVARTSGWDGQRLVLNEDDSPAEFSEAALRHLLTLPGMAVWCYQAYLRDVGVQEKN
jgi:hypothetical protein